MKKSKLFEGRSSSRGTLGAIATSALLAANPVRGAEDLFTATGWLTSVPVPGIVFSSASGQKYFKGNVHVIRLESQDSRISGRLQAMPEVAFQADGTHTFTGTAYDEVGTWDSSGTKFTPSGGVWELNYRGVTETDGRVHYDMTGLGVGNPIDGLRFAGTADRAAGQSFEPALTYHASGVIIPNRWICGWWSTTLTIMSSPGADLARGMANSRQSPKMAS